MKWGHKYRDDFACHAKEFSLFADGNLKLLKALCEEIGSVFRGWGRNYTAGNTGCFKKESFLGTFFVPFQDRHVV